LAHVLPKLVTKDRNFSSSKTSGKPIAVETQSVSAVSIVNDSVAFVVFKSVILLFYMDVVKGY
jgi:hypothetical protein